MASTAATLVAKHVSIDDYNSEPARVMNAQVHVTAELAPRLDLCVSLDMAELLRHVAEPGPALASARVCQYQYHEDPEIDADMRDWPDAVVRLESRASTRFELQITQPGTDVLYRLGIQLEG